MQSVSYHPQRGLQQAKVGAPGFASSPCGETWPLGAYAMASNSWNFYTMLQERDAFNIEPSGFKISLPSVDCASKVVSVLRCDSNPYDYTHQYQASTHHYTETGQIRNQIHRKLPFLIYLLSSDRPFGGFLFKRVVFNIVETAMTCPTVAQEPNTNQEFRSLASLD